VSDAAEPVSRLELALDVYVRFCEGGGTSPAELLAAHPDLADLLTPLFADAGAAAEPPSDANVIGDFRLLRELGRGGMGVVYEAWQRSLDRRIALKLLAPALTATPSAVARFRREAAAIARLRHPGIVEVHGFGSDGDRHWFAMGLVDGEPLSRCTARFASPRDAVALVVQVLDALAHSHQHGFVHRDVKPGNVLVGADGHAVLTDFGLAQDASLPSVTTDGGFVGTLDYASPEQLQGLDVDARTDVWAVGVMLHELLAGARPFARSTATATLKAILGEDPPSLVRRRGVPGDLAAAVQMALQKDPARRYPDAAAFLADLRAWQAGGVLVARAPNPVERLLRWTRREPWRAATLALAILALPIASASLVQYLHNRDRLLVAQELERAARHEQLLTEAWLAQLEGRFAAGLEQLERLDGMLPPAVAEECALARALLLVGLQRDAEAKAVLQPFADRPAVQQALPMLGDADTRQLLAALPGRGGSAIECFVLGQIAYDAARAGEPTAFAVANRHFATAAAMAGTPRAPFLFWWMVAASRADDAAGFQTAYAATELHFGASPALRQVAVYCASMLPVERGLELLGGVDLAAAPQVHLALATLLARAGRVDDSDRAYAAGLVAEPRNAMAWQQLIHLRMGNGRIAEAADAAQRAVERLPDRGDLWSLLGACLAQQDRRDDAIAAFRRACELLPTAWRPHLNLGGLLLESGDATGGLAALSAAAQMAPNEVQPHALTARALRQLGRREEAFLADLRALAAAPGDWRQTMVVGVRAAELGLRELALCTAERATQLGPEQASAWSRLAELLLDAHPGGDAARALAAAQRAFALSGGTESRGVWVLARAEARTGQVDAARARLTALLAQPRLAAAVRQLAEAELAALPAGR
jgi:tetratricopeptide (TPR) repeat protein